MANSIYTIGRANGRVILQKNRGKIAPQINFQEIPKPQTGKQYQFVYGDADITIFGGAAGSSKTFGALLTMIRHIKNPKFKGVIFRRTNREITDPGGLKDESMSLYPMLGGILNQNSLDWTFPSGAKVSFRHLQHRKTVLTYQGAQFTLAILDEGTHWPDDYAFFYLLSRLRSTSGIKPSLKVTCNPDADSWLRGLLDWWIDKDGYPIDERSGVVRYFYRKRGELVWADSVEDLKKRNPSCKPLSFTFISANIYDNPKLLEANPEYLANLEALHPVEMERLLKGNWNIRYGAGTVFDPAWFKVVDNVPSGGQWVRFWDLAATAKEQNPSACYTSGAKICRVGDDFYIADLHLVQVEAGKVETVIRNIANLDGNKVKVSWEVEGGSSGKIVESEIRKQLLADNPNLSIKPIKPQGDKLTRALPLAQAASQGRVYLLRDTWNTRLLNACQQFDGTKKDPPVNDIIDSLSGAFNYLVDKGRGGDPLPPGVY